MVVRKVAPINFFIMIFIVISIAALMFRVFVNVSERLLENTNVDLFGAIGSIVGIFIGIKLLFTIFPNVKF